MTGYTSIKTTEIGKYLHKKDETYRKSFLFAYGAYGYLVGEKPSLEGFYLDLISALLVSQGYSDLEID